MMRVLATIAAFAMLAASALPAYGIQCKIQGKSWRLVDGRKCWTDRWMPKAGLTWATPAKPVAKVARPARFRAAAAPQPPPPPLPPALKSEALEAILEAKAEAMRARLDVPRVVRTVLVSPYPVVEVVEPPPVPMPRPRPVEEPHTRPAGLLWLPLLLMVLMIGTAATEREQ